MTINSLHNAYLKQRELTQKFNDRLIGYKIGFSSNDTQQKFNINEPAYGKLYHSMLYKNNLKFKISEFVAPLIEVEIAIKLSKNIEKELNTINEIKKYIKSYFMSVELPDLRVKNSGSLNAFQIIADNLAAKYFIINREREYSGEDFINCKAELFLNGKLIRIGEATNVLGSPLNALLWLSRKLISQDDYLKKGQIILTGSFTEIFLAEKGDYKVVFSNPDETLNFSFI